MLEPSTTIRASASVECNWSSTNEEVSAQLRAVRPATTDKTKTARRRLASLPLALGFAIRLGGLCHLLDFTLCPGFYPAE
jgi:hypothetical protein